MSNDSTLRCGYLHPCKHYGSFLEATLFGRQKPNVGPLHVSRNLFRTNHLLPIKRHITHPLTPLLIPPVLSPLPSLRNPQNPSSKHSLRNTKMSQPIVPLNAIKKDLKEIKSSNDLIISMATVIANDELLALALQQQQYIEEMKTKIQISQDEHYAEFLEDEEMQEIEAIEEEDMQEEEEEEEEEGQDEDWESEMETDEDQDEKEEMEEEEGQDDDAAPSPQPAN